LPKLQYSYCLLKNRQPGKFLLPELPKSYKQLNYFKLAN
jgi:hypothetical protein